MKKNLELEIIERFVLKGVLHENEEEILKMISKLYNPNDKFTHPLYSDLQHKIWVCDKLIPTYPNEQWNLEKKIYQRLIKYYEIHEKLFC